MAALRELFAKLRSNESAAANDYDFHDRPFYLSPRNAVPGELVIFTSDSFRRLDGFRGNHFSGMSKGAPLSLTRTSTNLARSVLLALRPTVWMSSGPS